MYTGISKLNKSNRISLVKNRMIYEPFLVLKSLIKINKTKQYINSGTKPLTLKLKNYKTHKEKLQTNN